MKPLALAWEVHSYAADVLLWMMLEQTRQNGGRSFPCEEHNGRQCYVHQFSVGGEEGYGYMKALIKLAMLMEDGKFAKENFLVYVDRGHGFVEWDLLGDMIQKIWIELAKVATK